jgi:hypothetical protein
MNAPALLVNLLKFGAGSNPFARPELRQRLSGADGQPFPPFGAPSLEHVTAVFCAHPNQKAVGFPAASRVRLERPFPLHIPSFFGTNRQCYSSFESRIVCSESARLLLAHYSRLTAQNDGFCATVASFRPAAAPPQGSCTFGLSPKFSTPVEKTVEIRLIWLQAKS